VGPLDARGIEVTSLIRKTLRMKHLLAFFALCAIAVPLLGGVASAQSDPAVVVYPLTVSGNTDPQSGGKVAALYATRIGALGGVTVKAPAPGTDRKNYLEAARNAGADYYVTGYISPLGSAVTLINQVVSTHSGIQIWSDSIQIASYTEATPQADAIRTAILRHAGRYAVSLEATPPPAATATPAAQKNQANLNALFQKHSGPDAAAGGVAAGAPAATPQPAANAPSNDDIQVAVVHVIGKADAAAKFHAENQIALELTNRVKVPLLVDVQTSDLALQGAQVCLSNALVPTARVFGGTLEMTRIDPGFSNYALAKFDLVVYDCAGNLVAKQHSDFRAIGRTADDLALDGAIKETFDAVLGKQGKKHR
jgi:hypothetical protein